jgi:hypothetical protein
VAASISAAQRRKVIALHGEGKGRNEIAKAAGVAAGTVTKIIKDEGLSFDRTHTEVATQARKSDMRARRAELAQLLLEDAHRLREQLWKPCTAFNFGGKDNTYAETHLEEPIFADKLKIVQAAGNAITKHIDLEKVDAEQGTVDAKSMLGQLADKLGVQKPDQ